MEGVKGPRQHSTQDVARHGNKMMIPIYQTSQVTEELKGTTASSRVGENQKYGTAETMGEGGFCFGAREKPKSKVVNIKR